MGGSKKLLGLIVIGAASLAMSSVADAGKGGGKPAPTNVATLVLAPLTDPVVNHGDSVTFTSDTSAASPFVRLECWQGGTYVYGGSIGLFESYPWDKFFILRSLAWSSGAANCKATLYTTRSGERTTTLATLNFDVAA